MKIAICDDDITQIKFLSSLVKKWTDENSRKSSIDTYKSAEAFQFAWNEGKSYDVLLLDIQMPGQSGMELAKAIRQNDESIVIIFITAYSDYMDEGYDVSALHYLLKPVNEKKLFECLNKACRKLNTISRTLLAEYNSETLRIRQDEILYIEAFAHSVVISTVKQNYEIRTGIGNIEKEVEPKLFVRTHRSYLVGLKFIQRIGKTELILDNGTKIPVSRRQYSSVNKAFINFYKGEE